MYIYIIALLLSLLFIRIGDKGGKNSLFLQIVGVLVLVVIAGCRDETVGTDTANYPLGLFYAACESRNIIEMGIMSGFVEPGYLFMEYVVSRLTNNFNWLLTVTHIIILFNILYALRKYKINIALGIFVFFCIFFNTSLNIARQSLALSFIPMAFYYFVNEKYGKFIVFFALACSFHSSTFISSIIFILYFLVEKKENVYKRAITKFLLIAGISVFVLGISTVITTLSDADIIASKYSERYATSEIYGSNLPLSNVYINFINLFLIYKLRKLYSQRYRGRNIACFYPVVACSESKSNRLFILMEYTAIISVIFCFSAYVSTFLVRITQYFLLVNVFFISYLVCYSKTRLKVLTILLYSFYWFMVTYKNLGDVLPYTSKILGI